MTTAIRLVSLLLAALVLAMPVTATAQGQAGSLTITSLPTALDNPATHPVRVELSGGGLAAPIVRDSETNTVRFTDLPLGTYEVRELPTRTGDVARTSFAPFTVSIPTGELFDVKVYPKSQPVTLRKSASVSTVTPGTSFNYILDGAVPLPDTEGRLFRYVIRDELPAGLTLGDHATLEFINDGASAPLTLDEHYTLTRENGTVITSRLTTVGLQALADVYATNPAVTVRFTFNVKPSKDLRHGSYLLNIAHLYPDGYPEDGGNSVTSNELALPVKKTDGMFIPVIPLIPAFLGGSSSSSGSSGPVADISTPTAPDAPGESTGTTADEPPPRPSRGGLASTGASVLGAVALGALLILIGITVMKRGRRA